MLTCLCCRAGLRTVLRRRWLISSRVWSYLLLRRVRRLLLHPRSALLPLRTPRAARRRSGGKLSRCCPERPCSNCSWTAKPSNCKALADCQLYIVYLYPRTFVPSLQMAYDSCPMSRSICIRPSHTAHYYRLFLGAQATHDKDLSWISAFLWLFPEQGLWQNSGSGCTCTYYPRLTILNSLHYVYQCVGRNNKSSPNCVGESSAFLVLTPSAASAT